MSQSLLPYSVPSNSQPTVNQSFTGVASIAPPQSELNSSSINVFNDINVGGSINGLMSLRTAIGYTPKEFCESEYNSDNECWFLMTEPNKSINDVEFRLPMPEKTFFFQGVMSDYNPELPTRLTSLLDNDTVEGDTVEGDTPAPTQEEDSKNQYTFPVLGLDVGYNPIDPQIPNRPCCSEWPSTTQALFRCADDTRINSGVAVTSSNSEGLGAGILLNPLVLSTQNAGLSTPGTVGANKDQFCTISVCNPNDLRWILKSGGIVVALSYWEVPFAPIDSATIITPGKMGVNTIGPRQNATRNTSSRAAFTYLT